jgi:hypothetical protein
MQAMRVLRFVLPVLLAAAPLAPHPALAQIAIGVSVTAAPPELPVYEQPEIPGSWLHLDAWLLGVGR